MTFEGGQERWRPQLHLNVELALSIVSTGSYKNRAHICLGRTADVALDTILTFVDYSELYESGQGRKTVKTEYILG